jgi:predicted branched-subunit amino acid permease
MYESAIGIELGFDPIMTYATSLIIFGGASQIVFLQLLSGGASSLIAITSVGVINSRHLLYGAVLSEYLNKLSTIKKLFISYFIVDQGFAVSNIYFKKNIENKILIITIC